MFVAYEVATLQTARVISFVAAGGALGGAMLGRQMFGDWSRFIDSAVQREVVRKRRDLFAWFMHGVGLEVLVLVAGAVAFAFGDAMGRGIAVALTAGVVGWCAALGGAQKRRSS